MTHVQMPEYRMLNLIPSESGWEIELVLVDREDRTDRDDLGRHPIIGWGLVEITHLWDGAVSSRIDPVWASHGGMTEFLTDYRRNWDGQRVYARFYKDGSLAPCRDEASESEIIALDRQEITR